MGARDVALAVLVAVLWGFTFPVIHVGLGSFPPLLFSALRFVAAAFPAVLFVGRGNVPRSLILTVGLLFGVAYFSFLFIGMHIGMPAGLSSLVVQSQMLFTALISAVVLRDAPTRVQLAGMAVACSGMAVIGWEFAGGGSLTGLALVVAAAAVWGATNIVLKRAGDVDMFRLMVHMSVVPVAPLLLLSWLFEDGQGAALAGLDWRGAGAALYTGLVATVLCFGIWARLLRRHSPTVVAPFSLLVPVFGMALSGVLLGETYSAVKLAGSALVFAGLGLNVAGRRRGCPVSRGGGA